MLQEYVKGSELMIQQRPLPHVPTSLPFSSQYGQSPTLSSNSPMASNTVFFPGPYRTNNGMPGQQGVVAGQINELYNRQLMVPNPNAVRRSSSQDQLYSAIPGVQRNRALYGSPNQNVPLSHLQHSQQRHLGYSTFPHLQPNTTRKSLHLTTSSPSPSSSSTISTPAGYLAQASGQSAHIYQAPLLLKNAQVTSTSPAGIYGHIRGPHQMLQPSMSYQNLHFNSEIAAATNEMGMGGYPNVAYTRPMTSIGILPLNSSLSTGNRVDTQLEQAKMIGPNLTSPSQMQPQSLPGLNRPSSNTTTLQPRQLNLSSTSSASLPSTPEHSQQPSQFPYRAHPPLQSPVGKQSMTPPPSVNLTSVDGASLRSPDLYGAIVNVPQSNHQNVYGTLGHQAHRPASIIPPQTMQSTGMHSTNSQLPSTKVRTRYVCIGSDSELSFQPNMIITNGKWLSTKCTKVTKAS